jgi:hypothetical protein
MTLSRNLLPVLAALTVAGCQNADLLKPAGQQVTEPGEERAFTRIGEDDPGPLTSELAYDWFDRIRESEGEQKLELINEFLAAFPEAQRLPDVQEMHADALAAERRLGEAADAYERALVMTRTDITGLPLSTELPLQLALTRLSSGDVEAGTDWLLRTSIAERGERVVQGLRWAFANNYRNEGPFDEWQRARRAAIAPAAPPFSLPGLLTTEVALDPGAAVTLVNFWSPT